MSGINTTSAGLLPCTVLKSLELLDTSLNLLRIRRFLEMRLSVSILSILNPGPGCVSVKDRWVKVGRERGDRKFYNPPRGLGNRHGYYEHALLTSQGVLGRSSEVLRRPQRREVQGLRRTKGGVSSVLLNNILSYYPPVRSVRQINPN